MFASRHSSNQYLSLLKIGTARKPLDKFYFNMTDTDSFGQMDIETGLIVRNCNMLIVRKACGQSIFYFSLNVSILTPF